MALISKSLCAKEEIIPRSVDIFSMRKCKRYLRTTPINLDLPSIMLVDKLRYNAMLFFSLDFKSVQSFGAHLCRTFLNLFAPSEEYSMIILNIRKHKLLRKQT